MESRLTSSPGFHRPRAFTWSRSHSRKHSQITTQLVSLRRKTILRSLQKVRTSRQIAVPAVLSVFNWPRGSDRYRRIERFTERLFAKWDQFLVAPRHPKWRDVNLGATVPGWARYIAAQQMLERFYGPSATGQEDINRNFQAFLNRIGSAASFVPPIPAVAHATGWARTVMPSLR